MSSRPKKSNRHGYTLLEIILASMLAAVVLLIIATGIETQLRAFNAGRSHVEQAQLARVLLHLIDNDLRVLMLPREAAGSANDAASSKESDRSEGPDSELEGDQNDEFDDEATQDGPIPGVYGELNMLRFDVVRAKRHVGSSSDELLSDDAMPQAAGEIETLVYYVLTPEELAVEAVSTGSDQTGGGLVRRELLRPTAAWAAETGSMEYRDTAVSPIAPEVTAIEFRYHDGVEWLESWDSSKSGALPKAFEIRLFFAPQTPANSNPSQTAGRASGEGDDLPDVQYRLIVPVAIQGQSAGVQSERPNESSESSASSADNDDSDDSDDSDNSESSGGER